MREVICLGELLIDFIATRSGCTLRQAPGFRRAPGGAPANVAVGLTRLGVPAAFLGKVGDDEFGRYLHGVLAREGVDATRLSFTSEARTTLAFVSLGPAGERQFMFYRYPGADTLLSVADLPREELAAARAFHFGSLTLTAEPSRTATLTAAAIAREAGALISYDPNLRLPLWPSLADARAGTRLGLPLAHLVKVSEEELLWLVAGPEGGASDGPVAEGTLQQASAELLAQHPNLLAVLVTRGPGGCLVVSRQGAVPVPGFRVEAVDTTGAGDGFVAGVLAELLTGAYGEKNSPARRRLPGLPGRVEALQAEEWLAIARFANAAGACTVTRKGAIPALPTRRRVHRLLEQAAGSQKEG